MASYIPGYDEKRFATTVNRNFLCLICLNVLKDPVLCPRNQHCFCRACITKHLETSRRCPTCADELTVENLAEPNRMVQDILNELNIHCVYMNRGCQAVVQLQHLDRHEATCGFTPAVCTNQGCDVTLNQRDLIHHESEICEFRKLKCHSCGEMTKTLADMEKKITNVEKNMPINIAMETKMANLERNVANMEKNVANMEANVKRDIAGIKTDMEGKLEAVDNEVSGLKAALIEGFDQMKDVLVNMEDMKGENIRKVRNTASGDKDNIIVVGGIETDSVEMFNWRKKTWSPLQNMPAKRYGATSFVYNNHMTLAGGYCAGFGYVDSMTRLTINPNPDLSTHWSDCPIKLPAKLIYHSSVLFNDNLIVTGGYDDNLNAISDSIHEVQLIHPYTVKSLSRMPEPRRNHCMEIFGDNLLIVGGSTTGRYEDNLSSVVLYDIKKNDCKQLVPLPYEVSEMATMRWGDNIVVIGGVDIHGSVLDTVIIYNVKTEHSHVLPPMCYARFLCTAVVIGNNIVVLGGVGGASVSVEAFNFERFTWQEFPEMSEERWLHTAVVV